MEKIQGTDSPKDMVVKMCEGNPGALNVLMMLLTNDAGEPNEAMRVFDLLHLDDMGMRGPSIWVGYKDHCGEDLTKFRAAIRARDPEMVATIVKEGYPAVTSGASFA